MKELIVNVGDWIITKENVIRHITDDNMSDIKYEDIKSHATIEDWISRGKICDIPTKYLEKRMYFLVPYNMSDTQKGIQAGHASLEYARKYSNDQEFIDFVDNHKTWIILNGGTTRFNFSGGELGTLNQYLYDIENYNNQNHNLFENNPEFKIKYSHFIEPDLNDALTAICIVVDERVYNQKLYPDFEVWCREKMGVYIYSQNDYNIKKLKEGFENLYGKKISFLKNLLNNKKLA